jgi:murein DD-endopeptidase MepM/ murein hydrolase activator NlpD
MKGHPALDIHSGNPPGTPVVAAIPGLVYKVFNKDNADTTKYRCVFQIYESPDGDVYEVSYGHLNDIYVEEGDYLVPDQALGTEGNTGDVFTNGHAVSPQERAQGKGTHCHFQWRKVIKVSSTSAGKQYLDNITISGQRQESLFRDEAGNYYEVVNYDNGYHGCVDPFPFIYQPTVSEWLYTIIPNVLASIIKKIKGRNP